MTVSDEDKALIKNLHQLKEYGSGRIQTKCLDENWKRERLDILLKKKFGKDEAQTEGTRVAYRSTRVLKTT